jgi:hypothetical protein
MNDEHGIGMQDDAYRMSEYRDAQNRPSQEDYRKLNEGIIRKNPALGNLREDIIYNKDFLLEVQASGYNPLDAEDVQNYLEKKAPKDQERNITLCGAKKYGYLGQGEYEELDAAKMMAQQKGLNMRVKSHEDVYLSDIKNKEQRDYLTEKAPDVTFNRDKELSDEQLKGYNQKYKAESEDEYRSKLAKVFGSQEIKPTAQDQRLSQSTEVVKSDSNTEKILELIKELRALGFSPEEIKAEIQRLNR